MKKKTLLSLMIISSYLTMNAQWNSTNPVWTTSNVGIGTNNPTSRLQVNANDVGDGITLTHLNPRAKTWKLTSGVENYDHHQFSIKNQNGTYFVIDGNNGNTGIGAIIPNSKLHINANDAGDGITLTHSNPRAKTWKLTSGVENYDHHQFSIKNQNGTHFVIDGNNGNTGIGTITPAYKLDVCGTIRAKEVKVELFSGCDFVFKKDYKLMNLSDLEEYITTNQHLPEIASEKEMIDNGLNMKEFQMKLLQKIEELTLYVIEQNKQIKKQDQEIKKLKAIKKHN